MSNYKELSESEIKDIISGAEAALKEKKSAKRKDVISEIKSLAASIGVTVSINDGDSKATKKAPDKYRNPDNKSQTWTGRGIPKKWMQEKMDAGHDKSEFLI